MKVLQKANNNLQSNIPSIVTRVSILQGYFQEASYMVFGSLMQRKEHKAIFLGSPEAEAEATANSRMPLTEVYEDFHDLLYGLSGEKFIVVGRKGAGKSAFGEYVYARSLSEPNLWCNFIRKSDCDLERAVQIGT